MDDLPTPEQVENLRRSVSMLPPEVPALTRDEASKILAQLAEALRRLRDAHQPPEHP